MVQNISQLLIQKFRPFKCKNKYELYDKKLDNGKSELIVVKKCFVLHKEVIDVFNDIFYIPTIQNCHLIFLVSLLLVQWNLGKI